MRPSEVLARYRNEILEVIGRYPVSNPRIFGSTARGEDTDDSDLDILVDRDGMLTYIDLARLEIELERLLGVPVGVHTPGEFGPASMARIEADRRSL